MGPLFKPLKPLVELSFTRLMSEQAAWLGVPAVNTVACGTFKSPVPDARGLLLGLVPTAPRLARYLFKATEVSVTSPMLEGTRVVDAAGQVLSEQTQAQGEGFALAKVCLADQSLFPPARSHARTCRPTLYGSAMGSPRFRRGLIERRPIP